MNPKDECKQAAHELQAMIMTQGWVRFRAMVAEDIQSEDQKIEELLDGEPSMKRLQSHFAIRKTAKKYLAWVNDQIRRGQ